MNMIKAAILIIVCCVHFIWLKMSNSVWLHPLSSGSSHLYLGCDQPELSAFVTRPSCSADTGEKAVADIPNLEDNEGTATQNSGVAATSESHGGTARLRVRGSG